MNATLGGMRMGFAAAALLLTFGCAESAASTDVRTAAAVDLECDESEIKLDERRPRQTVATGCGREQIYRYKCTSAPEGDRDRKECEWVPIADPGN